MDSKTLTIILEAIAATTGVIPWAVASIHSAGCIILWDAREDADAAIMAAITHDNGGTIINEASITLPSGESILGLVLKADGDLDDFAGVLRMAYVTATGPDPGTLENPF